MRNGDIEPPSRLDRLDGTQFFVGHGKHWLDNKLTSSHIPHRRTRDALSKPLGKDPVSQSSDYRHHSERKLLTDSCASRCDNARTMVQDYRRRTG